MKKVLKASKSIKMKAIENAIKRQERDMEQNWVPRFRFSFARRKKRRDDVEALRLPTLLSCLVF